jgi:uncharacterized membrane protein YfcA
MELLMVSLASLLAGFVDSIVGGGGLILVPALFAAFPNTHPATLFGTNKGASVWGTAIATVQYSRRVQMRWHALAPAAAVCFAASFGVAAVFAQGAAPGAADRAGLHAGQEAVGPPPRTAF